MTQKGASLLWLVRGPDLVTLSAALGTMCFWGEGLALERVGASVLPLFLQLSSQKSIISQGCDVESSQLRNDSPLRADLTAYLNHGPFHRWQVRPVQSCTQRLDEKGHVLSIRRRPGGMASPRVAPWRQ